MIMVTRLTFHFRLHSMGRVLRVFFAFGAVLDGMNSIDVQYATSVYLYAPSDDVRRQRFVRHDDDALLHHDDHHILTLLYCTCAVVGMMRGGEGSNWWRTVHLAVGVRKISSRGTYVFAPISREKNVVPEH